MTPETRGRLLENLRRLEKRISEAFVACALPTRASLRIWAHWTRRVSGASAGWRYSSTP